MHQNVGPLTTVRCFLPVVPDASDLSTALAAQVLVAGPGHACGASLLQQKDLDLQVVHHQPCFRCSRRWPPLLGFLARMVLSLPV